MFAILNDIRTGALPREEIKPFVLWMLKRWCWVPVAITAATIAAVKLF